MSGEKNHSGHELIQGKENTSPADGARKNFLDGKAQPLCRKKNVYLARNKRKNTLRHT